MHCKERRFVYYVTDYTLTKPVSFWRNEDGHGYTGKIDVAIDTQLNACFS
jgi:hypothetical protein